MKTNLKYSGWDASSAYECCQCKYICTGVQLIAGDTKNCPKCGCKVNSTEKHPTAGRLLDGNDEMTISKCAAEVWYNTVVDDREEFWKNISVDEFLELGITERIKSDYLTNQPFSIGATSDDYRTILLQILEEMRNISWEDFGYVEYIKFSDAQLEQFNTMEKFR